MNQIKNYVGSLMFLKKGAWFSGWVKYRNKEEKREERMWVGAQDERDGD